MKRLLSILLVTCGFAASAITNKKIDLLPVGNPLIRFLDTTGYQMTGFSYALPAGDSTGLFVVYQQMSGNGNFTDTITEMTYGGVPMIRSANTVSATNVNGNKFFNVAIYFLNDSAAATRSDNVFRVSYSKSTAGTNTGYSFLIFSADEVKQEIPLEFCGAVQTGGNNGGQTITCAAPVSYNAGDLFLSVGGTTQVSVGPLVSNLPDSLINRPAASGWQAVFFKQLTTAGVITPSITVTGGNLNPGRFALLATQVKSVIPPSANPLGVTLESFEGRRQASGNLLTWTTAKESNLKHFELQYSAVGQAYTSVGYVNAGTGPVYGFSDALRPGKAFYRLKITDLDGSYTYSRVVTISGNSGNAASELSVFPNPSNGIISVRGNSAPAKLKVTNAFGQQVSYRVLDAGASTNTLTIQLDRPAPGCYYILAEQDGALSGTRVLVK